MDGDQHAEARTVDEVYLFKIQDDVLDLFLFELAEAVAEGGDFGALHQAPTQVEDCHTVLFAAIHIEGHVDAFTIACRLTHRIGSIAGICISAGENGCSVPWRREVSLKSP